MTGLQSGNIVLRRLKLKQAKVNISVCSLKREVKVKVNKFCDGQEETHQCLQTYQVRHTCD